MEAFDIGEPDTPAYDKDSSSNTRSKFNAEGGEWSCFEDMSVSLSKFSEYSMSSRRGGGGKH